MRPVATRSRPRGAPVPLFITSCAALLVILTVVASSPALAAQGKKQRVPVKSGDGDGDGNLLAMPNVEKNGHRTRLASVSINSSGSYTEWSLSTEDSLLGEPELDVAPTDESQVPLIPTALRAKPTANTILLSWTPAKNQKYVVRGYTVGWGIGYPDVHVQVLDAKERNFAITDLRPSSEYVISLRAFNHVGDGQPIYETVKTLIEDSPDPLPILPPVGLKPVVLSATTVVLYWTDSTLPRGQTVTDSRYYTVKYTNNLGQTQKFKYINSTDLNVVIDDLKPNTMYEFAVKVTKARQESTWSMSVTNTTSESAPQSPPRDLTVIPSEEDSGVIHLHWQPPKQPNGRITGYIIFYTTDNTQNDREWVVEAVVGDKMTTSLKGLLWDTTYFFKIQARNHKGYGPMSAEVSFKTLLISHGARAPDGKSISTHTLYIIIAGISLVTILLLLVVSILLCKSKRAYGKPKGYMAAATSPRGKGKGSMRDLNPPDLWIHHDQMELKALEKSNRDGETTMAVSPMPRTFQDMSLSDESLLDKSRKAASNYVSDALYDDVSKGPTSPTDTPISFVSGTNTARRTGRAKPIMIPVDSNNQTNPSVISFEPSTALSRPVYPRSQTNIARAHVTIDGNNDGLHMSNQVHHLYDPVSSSPLQLQSINGQLSNNISYSTGMGGHEMMASPNTNTLGKRSAVGGQPLKSFSVPTVPLNKSTANQPRHIAVRPQLITNSSPLKKMNPLTGSNFNSPQSGKPLPHIVTPSSRIMQKDDDVMSTYSTEELNAEMANLEGIMKDLNAITASEFVVHN